MNLQTADECKTRFDELKFRKVEARYIVYQIQNSKIVLDRVGAKNETWEQFVTSLPEKEYRYCVFDLEFTNQDKMAISKMVFVNWAPDTAPIKERVLYATAKQSFKKYLDLNTKDLTVCSKGDVILCIKPDDFAGRDQGNRTLKLFSILLYLALFLSDCFIGLFIFQDLFLAWK